MPFSVRVNGFRGEIPKLNYRMLPATTSKNAQNVFLTSGRLDPMYIPAQVATTGRTATSNTIYRMFDALGDYWLNWVEQVDVARSPIVGDASFKVSFTSSSFEPRQTNLALVKAAGTPYPNGNGAWYVLGVSPPKTAATIAPPGTGSVAETRSYIYTFVTPWGEESAPAAAPVPVSGYTFSSGSTAASWGLSGMDTPPANSYTISNVTWAAGYLTFTVGSTFGLRAGEYVTVSGTTATSSINQSWQVAAVLNATQFTVALASNPTITVATGTASRDAPHNNPANWTKRIYRTTYGGTGYYFVAEIAASSTTYTDTTPPASLQELCPTIGWAMPPATMQGVLTLPNGVQAGFYNNVLCLSVPYAPYAWPMANQLTADYPIIGLAAFGQSIVVCTQGTPYLVNCTDPAAATMDRIPHPWPCLSKRGIVAYGGSVFYPTTLGLAKIDANGPELLTRDLFSQIDWANVAPSTFISGTFDGRYYAVFTTSVGAEILIIDREIGVTRYNVSPTALYSDLENGKLYYLQNGSIFDMAPTNGAYMNMAWTSREYVVPNPVSLGAVQVNGIYTQSPAQVAQIQAMNNAIYAANAALYATGNIGSAVNAATFNKLPFNGSNMNTAGIVQPAALTFTLYVNDTAYYSTTVASGDAFRLPGGLKYDNFYYTISGTVPVEDVVIAETMQGLKVV